MAVLGDIALVGFAADAAGKSFSFVLLADLSGETINFTDNGWLAAGGFRANEGTTSYVVPADTPVGTVITISGLTGSFNPSTGGDQILAYVGSVTAPTFLFALDFADNNSTYAGDASNSNTSAVPTGLTLVKPPSPSPSTTAPTPAPCPAAAPKSSPTSPVRPTGLSMTRCRCPTLPVSP
ncbi:hypothetical protein GCM10011529_24670 [Polymorphobacter glacialis]|uniref:Uncharacterized protein n=1 Tax=Sandarakinorhabdus glacialis TaxID=1614636 RepID=A0A916ZWY6_9SPHN|nr:hypothetical protein [Polymorphobacter glacialis]GGE17229.1 hypothetical protein GCM10011529_24670 [Polymorphobacter glacialis]